MKKFLFLVFVFLIFPFFVLATSKVDINTASLEQLDEIIGIGPVLAQRIIDARPFSSVDDLIRVNGIGEKTLQKIKDQGLSYVGNQSIQPTLPTPPEAPSEAPSEMPLETLAESFGLLPTEPQDIIVPMAYPDGVIFNEILPSPEGSDQENEWIELYNQNDFDVDLNNWIIKDTTGSIKKYILEAKIFRLGYLLLKRPNIGITLNNDGDGLELKNPTGEIVDSVNFGKASLNQSYNRTESGWTWSNTLTPEEVNIITTVASAKTSTENKKAGLPKDESLNENDNQEARLLKSKLTNAFKEAPRVSVFLIGFIVALFCSVAFSIIKSNIRGFWY